MSLGLLIVFKNNRKNYRFLFRTFKKRKTILFIKPYFFLMSLMYLSFMTININFSQEDKVKNVVLNFFVATNNLNVF